MPKASPALPGFYTLGVVNVGPDVLTNGINLVTAFPNEQIQGESVSSVIFCTHENNGSSGIIYIGDLTMNSNFSATAAYSLIGPNVIDTSLTNMGGLNTIPLANIKIGASAANLKVRVSVLVG